jgi:hypothetical protein
MPQFTTVTGAVTIASSPAPVGFGGHRKGRNQKEGQCNCHQLFHLIVSFRDGFLLVQVYGKGCARRSICIHVCDIIEPYLIDGFPVPGWETKKWIFSMQFMYTVV